MPPPPIICKQGRPKGHEVTKKGKAHRAPCWQEEDITAFCIVTHVQ